MGEFDRENAFILLVARGTLSEEERTKFEELLNAGLEWGYVSAQMERHRLFPLLASHWQSCGTAKNLETVLNEGKNNCTRRIRRSRILDRELCWLAESLAQKNITYAVLKGPILAHAVYDHPRKRVYTDIDILVKKSDADAVSKIIKEQGYIQGQFDKEKQEIVPAPRKNVLWCSMYIHQLYPFYRVVEQCPCKVEVQTKFFPLYENINHNLGSVDLSTSADCWQTRGMIEMNDKRISTLNWKYFLLQLCLHAYMDEVSIERIVYNNGVRLRHYCDIRELLKRKRDKINLEDFITLVESTGTNKSIYYILANLSTIYGDMLEMVLYILDEIRPKSLSFMNEFGHQWEIIGKKRGQFSKPFVERIFGNSAQEDFERQKHLFRNRNSA